MKFKRGLGFLTVSIIAVAPMAAVVSCGTEAAPLNMEGSIVSRKTEANPFQLYNMPFKDGKMLFTQAQLDKLHSKLKDLLYYGPEAWDLKSITLDTGSITSGNQLGVYYPASKQIFINISDLENVSIDQAYDVIEKVTAHEYGHHFFATYANGYKRKVDPAIEREDGYVYDTNGNYKYVEPWNKDYFEDFLEDYNIEDEDKMIMTSSKDEIDIDLLFSLKDLFDNANQKGATLDWGQHNKVLFSSSLGSVPKGLTAQWIDLAVAKSNSNLKYIYSMDEQVTRKMQMLFYPGNIDPSRYGFEASVIKPSSRTVDIFADPYAVDWLRTANIYSDGTKLYKKPIYNDDIFESGGVEEAYQSLLNLMGYGKQINHMYSKNTAMVSSPNSTVGGSSHNNNYVKLTGFIDPTKKFTKIVAGDNDELVTNIHVNSEARFHFKHKATWNALEANVGPKPKDKYGDKIPYSTDEFYIGKFVGKKLYFMDGNGVKTPITDINLSKDGNTNVNSFDSQRNENDRYYKLSIVNGFTKVEAY